MNFDVYCDENFPDLFTSEHPLARYMMIGSVWIPVELRREVKTKVADIREAHNTWGEIKWTKVIPQKWNFYSELIKLFFSYGTEMRFRCIAIDRVAYYADRNNGDNELGFYKFYYQMLHHWIFDHNNYTIFCDTKLNRDKNRLKVLQRCLAYANINSTIARVQSLPSKELVLMQLCDLLLGAASSRLNNTLTSGSTKEALVHLIERQLDIHQIAPTAMSEQKFNIFQINLKGGW